LRFYDIASHLAEQTQLNNTTTTSSSTSQSLPNPKYFRSLFSNQDNITNDNDNKHHHVTVIALSSLHDERANTDAWINNLEHIYNNLVEQKSFHNIRLILINLKDSYNPIWVNRIRKKVSFEVYQELPSSPISNLLDGHSGDVYIFDRCNLLAYYIRFPLSFIDRKDPFFQATILAAHTDSPCKEKCVNPNLSPNNITDNQNETLAVTEISSSSTTTTLTPVVDNVDSIENNQTDTTTTNELNELNVFSQMGQVLKIFYNRYTMNFEPEIESSNVDSSSTTVMPNITTNLIDTLNRTLETYGLQKSQQNISIDDSTIKSKNVTTKTGNGELRSTLSQPPKFKNGSKLSEVCQQTNCTEWSTERLLAARLCCLSITTEDDDEPMVNVNATVFIPSNGGFGCKLYPRTTCSMIKPVLRCCTRKLVNQYFTYAIQLRERQRQQFGPGQRSVRKDNVDVATLGNSKFNSKPASSAICFIRLSVCASGDIVPIALLIVLSIVFVCTSKSSNCFSNLSIICEIFSKFIDFIAESIALVTPPIDCAIDLVATAVCTRLATASTRLAIRKKFKA
ncbi:selenium binding, partial [Dermatophagoides pteronyssinus]